MAVLETRHVDAQTVGVHAQVSDEELVVLLEKEECGVSVLTQLVPMPFTEVDDLMLCETQNITIQTERIEHVFEVGVFHHFVDGDLRLLGGGAGFVEIPVFEVRIAMHRKCFLGLPDRAFSVAGGDGGNLVGVEKTEDRFGLRNAAVQNFDQGFPEQFRLKQPFISLYLVDFIARNRTESFHQKDLLRLCHVIRHVILPIHRRRFNLSCPAQDRESVVLEHLDLTRNERFVNGAGVRAEGLGNRVGVFFLFSRHVRMTNNFLP